MSALTAVRNTPYVNGPSDPKPTGLPTSPGQVHILPVAASVKIYQGALVCLNGGYAAPMTVATGLVAVGYAQITADNTAGSAGAISVLVSSGMSAWAQSGGAITTANAGSLVYGVDDQTVTLTSTGASIVGVVDRVDTAGVWVLIDPLANGIARGVVTTPVPVTVANGGTNSTTALSGNSIMISDGTHVVQGSKGTTSTVLHGNAAGSPAYGSVVAADLGSNAVTGPALSAASLRFLPITGQDATGGALSDVCTGTKIGDTVVGVVGINGGAPALNEKTASESTITVADHIQQLNTDLSTSVVFALVVAKS